VRPRIQATVSQKAFDIIVSGIEEIGGPLYNQSFSRAVDRIILEWEENQNIIKSYQNKAAEYHSQVTALKKELGENTNLKQTTLEITPNKLSITKDLEEGIFE